MGTGDAFGASQVNTIAAAAGRIAGKKLRAYLRHGPNAANASARTSEYSKAAADSRRGVQLEPDCAKETRRGNPAEFARPPEPPISLSLSVMDGPARSQGTICSSTGHFCRQILVSSPAGPDSERRLKNAGSTTGC